MKNYDALREKILLELKDNLKPNRFRHTLGVESTAIALANLNQVDPEEASIAALLHDIAKYFDFDTYMFWLKGTSILERFPDIGSFPKLLHAFAGAQYAQKKYPELNEDIINSVRYHTTGRAGMGTLEKIIFAADYIEPGRKDFPGLLSARERTFDDLDQGVYLILKQTVSYLEQNEEPCFLLTKEAFNDMIPMANPSDL